MLPTEWTIGQNEGRLVVPRTPSRIPHSRHGAITSRASAHRAHRPALGSHAGPAYVDTHWRSAAAVEGQPRRIVHSANPQLLSSWSQTPNLHRPRRPSNSIHMDNRRIHFTVGSSMSISSQSASDDSAMEDISNGNIPSSLESAVSSSRSTLACSAASSMSTACDEAEPSGESMLARCKQFFKRLNHRSGLQPASSAEKAWPALPDSSLTYVQSDSGLSFRSVSSGITIAPASSRGASMPVLSSAAETMGGGRTALWTSVGADGWVKRRQW